jgi:hypothetical protein
MDVTVEVGTGRVAVDMGGVTLEVGGDCAGEAQAANRQITTRKTYFFIPSLLSVKGQMITTLSQYSTSGKYRRGSINIAYPSIG